MDGQHERQTPALRLLGGLGVEFWDGVREVWFYGGDGVAGEIGEFGDLVGEHFLDCVGLEDAVGGCGGDAVV